MYHENCKLLNKAAFLQYRRMMPSAKIHELQDCFVRLKNFAGNVIGKVEIINKMATKGKEFEFPTETCTKDQNYKMLTVDHEKSVDFLKGISGVLRRLQMNFV